MNSIRIVLAFGIAILQYISLPASGQVIDFAREIVDTLCSPYMAGRGYVNDGDLKAAVYIAGEFQKNELERFHNSYFQNFNVAVNTFPGRMTLKTGVQELTPGSDYIVNACSPGLSGAFETFALKRSWIRNKSRLEKKLGDHKGKVMIIDESRLSASRQELASFINELDKGMPKPAAAMVLTEGKLTASVSSMVCSFPVMNIKKSALSNAKKLEQGKLNVSVDIEQRFENAYQTQNVIGFIPGTERRDSLIVFTAHYDHLGTMGEKTYFPGANDNASGVAMALSLARHFAEEKPAYTVVFIAFGAEELNLSGSRYFVENPLFPLEKISFLINIDLAGTGDEGITAVNGTIFKDHFHALDSINYSYGLLPKVNPRGEACNSDHCFFYREGVPSFFIYTLGGIQAYHDVFDKAETLPLTEFEDYYSLLVLFSRNAMKH